MREEQSKDKKIKLFKALTVLILTGVGIYFILTIGVHATSSPAFCATCHNMSPQVYTWQASSHSGIGCTDCHIAPGVENLVREKANGVKQLYYKVTDSYLAPIRMPNLIPNEACQTCHNMELRHVSASGDIIIDHEIHEIKDIACVACHDGVAHGKVSERRVTFRSDYARWNDMLARRFMEDTKYTRPQMETCMDCHELMRAPLECAVCHETGMLPEEHKAKDFIAVGHMQQARDDIYYCDFCHSYTTKNQVEGLQGKAAYLSYMSGEAPNGVTVTAEQYAKTNDYCRDCHGIRPDSHKQNLFLMNHGRIASNNTDRCMTCHDFRIVSDAPVTNVGCASCHPSSHPGPWKDRHPVPIMPNQKLEQSCMQCHVEARCTSCHAYARRD